MSSSKIIEQEIMMLKITIDHMADENSKLIQELEDLKMTIQTNKNLLKEYLSQITNQDTTVQKLNVTIDHLKIRLNSFQVQYNNNSCKEITKEDDPNTPTIPLSTRKITPKMKLKTKAIAYEDNDYNNYCEKHHDLLTELTNFKASLIELIKQQDQDTPIIPDIQTSTNANDLTKLLNHSYSNSNKVILFIDNDKQVWEMIPEPNMTEKSFENITLCNTNDNEYNERCIEIKMDKEENNTINETEVNISKGSAFSVNSNYLDSLK